MTLSTYLYVHDPIDIDDLWAEANRIIGAVNPLFDDDDKYSADGLRCRSNRPGQGFCAWLLVTYATGGIFPSETCDEDCESPCTASHEPAHSARVNLDTAYSYSDANGGCGALHARLVARLGAWLDQQGTRWSWQNEFTGEIHQGYDGLEDLDGKGQNAAAWLADVMLLIQAEIGKSR